MKYKIIILAILLLTGLCGATANDSTPFWTNTNIKDVTQMAIIDNYLFVMNNDNMIYKINSYTGAMVDSTDYFDGATDYVYDSNLAISPDQSTLYVSNDLDIFAFNTSDLEIKWSHNAFGSSTNGILVDAEGYVYFVDQGSDTLFKLDPDTGAVYDSIYFPNDYTPQGYPAISPNGELIVMQFNDGNFLKAKMIYTENLTICVNGSSNLGSPSEIKNVNTFITPTTAIVYSADTIYKFTSTGTVTAITDENIYNEAETNDYAGAVIDGDNRLYTVSTYNSTGFIVNAYSHNEGVYTFDWASNQIDLIDDYLVFAYGEPLASVDNMIYINAIAGNAGTGDVIAAHICIDGMDGSVEWINTDLTAKSIDYDTIQQALFGSALGINMVYMTTTDGIYAYDTTFQPTHKPNDVFSEITFYTSNTRTSAYQQTGNNPATQDEDEPVLGGGGSSGGSSTKKVTDSTEETIEEIEEGILSTFAGWFGVSKTDSTVSSSFSTSVEETSIIGFLLMLGAYLGAYMTAKYKKSKEPKTETFIAGSLVYGIAIVLIYVGFNPFLLNSILSSTSILIGIITFITYGVGAYLILNKKSIKRVRR